jgi:hypothetical protein
MKTFVVTWQIDMTAETKEEAAQMALEVMRSQNSTALFFNVSPRKEIVLLEPNVDLAEEA